MVRRKTKRGGLLVDMPIKAIDESMIKKRKADSEKEIQAIKQGVTGKENEKVVEGVGKGPAAAAGRRRRKSRKQTRRRR